MNTTTLLSLVLAIASLLNVSCVVQRTKKPTGEEIVQITAFAKSSLVQKADGSVKMTADAEKAVEGVKEITKIVGTNALIGKSINAAQSLGNNAVDELAK